MDMEEDTPSPGDKRLPPLPAHLQTPASVCGNSFDGVRHGFNSGSFRTTPYPPAFVSNSAVHQYRLPHTRSVLGDHCLDYHLVRKLVS
jgi:hypothetical protein